jgi:hypothetical protein
LKIRNDSYDGEEDDADFGPDPFGKDQGDSELDELASELELVIKAIGNLDQIGKKLILKD